MPGAVSIDGGWSGLQSYTTGHHPEAMAYTLGRAVRLEARAITAHPRRSVRPTRRLHIRWSEASRTVQNAAYGRWYRS